MVFVPALPNPQPQPHVGQPKGLAQFAVVQSLQPMGAERLRAEQLLGIENHVVAHPHTRVARQPACLLATFAIRDDFDDHVRPLPYSQTK